MSFYLDATGIHQTNHVKEFVLQTPGLDRLMTIGYPGRHVEIWVE
jgi:hypothetical protein